MPGGERGSCGFRRPGSEDGSGTSFVDGGQNIAQWTAELCIEFAMISKHYDALIGGWIKVWAAWRNGFIGLLDM